MELLKQPYQYKVRLTEPGAIRLIELQPSLEPEAAIKCTLLHRTFSELNDELIYHYCALSYVWGTSFHHRSVTIDDEEVRITVSLETALRHLRDPVLPRYLWADAICINQDDDDEKAVQVAQMGEVYKAARHTIIRLGEASSFELP